MSAQTKPKQSSRWGSLLQGAVANLESRLDNILAEEGAGKRPAEAARPVTPDPVKNAATSLGRDPKDLWARNRTRNDAGRGREERRLSTESANAHENESATNQSEIREVDDPSARNSEDGTAHVDTIPKINIDSADGAHTQDYAHVGTRLGDDSSVAEPSRASSFESFRSHLTSEAGGGMQEVSNENTSGAAVEQPKFSVADYQVQIAQLRANQEAAELHRQEEVHGYLERIDTLQAKLQYLSNEIAQSARESAEDAPSDSLESQLAAKTEQIARLMEEGQKLSKAEVNQSVTARKLRAKALEDGRTIAETRRKLAAAEKTASDTFERIARLELNLKDASAKSARLGRVEREVEDLRRAQFSKNETIEGLQRQIDALTATAQQDQKQAVAQAIDSERKIAQSLRDDIASLRVEKQLSDDRIKAHTRTANEDLQRERERWSLLEAGLRNEISVLEGRMEVFRVRNEEVSAGITSDSQAKFMRQIETLQSQYAQASENWQGIESALQARLSDSETQRSEAARQETEARRKLRESGSNARRLQEQLDDTSRRCNIMEHELSERQAHADQLQSRATGFEKQLREARQGFEDERRVWEAKLNARIEEEKFKLRQEMAMDSQSGPSQIDSPTLSFRKQSALELPINPIRRGLSRHASVEFSHSPLERTFSATWSRRGSSKPGRASDPQTPNGGFESGRSTPFILPAIPDSDPGTPTMNPVDQDDMSDSASLAHQAINDVGSGSTAGPGPSVQLVERMSAAVRRLESEKSALKDEMARLSTQRDEGRKEMVSLMREVETKRAVDAKVVELDAQVLSLNQRYQTTLEMLGEKSERVDELEADVVDLKTIYKELVSSMK